MRRGLDVAYGHGERELSVVVFCDFLPRASLLQDLCVVGRVGMGFFFASYGVWCWTLVAVLSRELAWVPSGYLVYLLVVSVL